MMKKYVSLLFLLLATSYGQKSVETGTIEWGRNYEEAQEQSQKTGKPIFLLFQEVPGCQGCQDFGKEVLSNPLIKKAVEESFIPIYIRNNASSGHDLEILKKFREPAWNYQVVRFIGTDGKELIPRKDKVWEVEQLATRMKKALKKAKQPIPDALDLVSLENEQEHHRLAAFSMFCYWTGEAELGKIDGVISTEAGWLDGHEVTLVKYHQKRVSLEKLTEQAVAVDCARGVYLPDGATVQKKAKGIKYGTLDDSYRIAKQSDQKKQLQGLKIVSQKFTPAQLTKLNAWARSDRDVFQSYL